uniref:uncharacterized protein LOC120340731 n=1 Tax=Styela clava TaxID=7725 RepID=UPI00193A0342|nr:uncharacterized protein LOC120340731 [Styela clava]
MLFSTKDRQSTFVAMFAIKSRSNGVGKNQRYSIYWTPEKEIQMIKYFEEHRYMWDTDHILFHKREPRMKGYSELVQLLDIDEGTIRQRWSSMRSQFCREERKVTVSPTYVPTWDHYTTLLFLRKSDSSTADRNRQYNNVYEGSQNKELQVKEEYGEVVSLSQVYGGDEDQSPLVQDNLSFSQNLIHEEEDSDDDQENAIIENATSLSDRQNNRTTAPAAGEPVAYVRKHRIQRRVRRWNPDYQQKHNDSSSAFLQPSSSPPALEAIKEPRPSKENESFSQYIANVLGRFHPDKQRRCRNELLRIILKYDMCDDEANDGSH